MTKVDEQTAERILKISAMEEESRKAVFTPGNEILEHKGYSALGASSAGQDEYYNKKAPAPHGGEFAPVSGAQEEDPSYKREEAKVGRNDSCPCGSGKKYKKCCGR